jgi:hypothetical protein
MANIQPNRFVLQSSDGKIKVDYETTTFVGQPALNLTQAPAPPRHFAGSQIRTLATEIGTLVTVTTYITIDSGSTSFSVLIPAISLKGFGDHEAFATEAIITAHSGPIPIPASGAHERYQFVPLNGDASFVFTLIGPLIAAAKGSGT